MHVAVRERDKLPRSYSEKQEDYLSALSIFKDHRSLQKVTKDTHARVQEDC